MTKRLIPRSLIVSVAHHCYVRSCDNFFPYPCWFGDLFINENSLKLRLHACGDFWHSRLYYCRGEKTNKRCQKSVKPTTNHTSQQTSTLTNNLRSYSYLYLPSRCTLIFQMIPFFFASRKIKPRSVVLCKRNLPSSSIKKDYKQTKITVRRGTRRKPQPKAWLS